MPELIEVERYRRAADGLTGSPIVEVEAPDAWYLKAGLTASAVRDALVGRTIVRNRRRGKLLLVDLDDGMVVGLRFGMTGRLIVDDVAIIDQLLYAPTGDHPRWDRFAWRLADGRRARLQDPRRLGGVELAPDEDRLGPDAARVTARALGRALAGSRAPLKARLMDQAQLAGLGNLLTDEVLWRARLPPTLRAADVPDRAVPDLARTIRNTVALLDRRGGSHTGDLQPQRGRGGRCPRCGTDLRSVAVGGRTTVWCPTCQVAPAAHAP